MGDPLLDTIAGLIQQDVGDRGLLTDRAENLVTASAGGFQGACRSLAGASGAVVAVVTGFLVPRADPPRGETDGPLGALFLARALTPLGFRMVLAGDDFVIPALEAGVSACGLEGEVGLVRLPGYESAMRKSPGEYWRQFVNAAGSLTHLVGIERVGPSHTPQSLQAQGMGEQEVERFLKTVPRREWDRSHTMGGSDITEAMSPAQWLFESVRQVGLPITTIGIGDGGNEIGMGAVPWSVIRKNIPCGAVIACRIPVDHLIVCGVSNWGAYGLAAGVGCLRGRRLDHALFDPEGEQEILRLLVQRGSLVDGRTGLPTATVDGLSFGDYAEPLRSLRGL